MPGDRTVSRPHAGLQFVFVARMDDESAADTVAAVLALLADRHPGLGVDRPPSRL